MSDNENQNPRSEKPSENGEGETFHRRGFFTEGFRQLLKPLADIVEDRLSRIGVPTEEEHPDNGDYGGYDGYGEYGDPSGSRSWGEPAERTVLRPPGALSEGEFLDHCIGCAQCVNSCPVSAIQLAHSGDSSLDSKPFIDPQVQACAVCEDLAHGGQLPFVDVTC